MNSRSPFLPAVLVALVLVLPACASGGGSDESSGRDMNVLTPEEIEESRASNLYEAVNQLRPRWLQVRNVQSFSDTGSSDIAVFQGSSFLGGSEMLRQMGTDGVTQLRYMDAALANARLRVPDGRAMPGAIVVDYN